MCYGYNTHALKVMEYLQVLLRDVDIKNFFLLTLFKNILEKIRE